MAPPASPSPEGALPQRQGAIWQATTSPAGTHKHTPPETCLAALQSSNRPLALQAASSTKAHTCRPPSLSCCTVSFARLQAVQQRTPHPLLLEPPIR